VAQCENHLDKDGLRPDAPGLEELVQQAHRLLPKAVASQRQVVQLQSLYGDGTADHPPNMVHQEYLRKRPLNPEDAKLLRELENQRDAVSHAVNMAEEHINNVVAWLYSSERSAPLSEAEELNRLNENRQTLAELRTILSERIRHLKARREEAYFRTARPGHDASVSIHHLKSSYERNTNRTPASVYSNLRTRLKTSLSKGQGPDTTQIVNQSRSGPQHATLGVRSRTKKQPSSQQDKFKVVHAEISTPAKHPALRVPKAQDYIVTTSYPADPLGSAGPAARKPETNVLNVPKAGKVIVSGQAKTGWWAAEYNGERGLVRASYLTQLFDNKPSATTKEWVAKDNTVLSLKEGCRVSVIYKDLRTDWWEVTYEGSTGWFPGAFLSRPSNVARSHTSHLSAAARRLSTRVAEPLAASSGGGDDEAPKPAAKSKLGVKPQTTIGKGISGVTSKTTRATVTPEAVTSKVTPAPKPAPKDGAEPDAAATGAKPKLGFDFKKKWSAKKAPNETAAADPKTGGAAATATKPTKIGTSSLSSNTKKSDTAARTTGEAPTAKPASIAAPKATTQPTIATPKVASQPTAQPKTTQPKPTVARSTQPLKAPVKTAPSTPLKPRGQSFVEVGRLDGKFGILFTDADHGLIVRRKDGGGLHDELKKLDPNNKGLFVVAVENRATTVKSEAVSVVKGIPPDQATVTITIDPRAAKVGGSSPLSTVARRAPGTSAATSPQPKTGGTANPSSKWSGQRWGSNASGQGSGFKATGQGLGSKAASSGWGSKGTGSGLAAGAQPKQGWAARGTSSTSPQKEAPKFGRSGQGFGGSSRGVAIPGGNSNSGFASRKSGGNGFAALSSRGGGGS